jgi:hypothetical protein
MRSPPIVRPSRVARERRWCRIAIVRDGQVLARTVLDGDGEPGLEAVEVVARLALAARRLGSRVVCDDAVPALRDLLALAGLDVEVQRQPEQREEPLGREPGEEEVHSRDLRP